MTEASNPSRNPDTGRKPSPEAQRRAQEFMKKLKQQPGKDANSDEIARMAMEIMDLDQDGNPKNHTAPAPTPQPHIRTSVPLEELHSGTTRRLTMPNGKTIELTIPKGARHGLTITVKMPEDTFLVAVDQETHPGFQRKGDHLYANYILRPRGPARRRRAHHSHPHRKGPAQNTPGHTGRHPVQTEGQGHAPARRPQTARRPVRHRHNR